MPIIELSHRIENGMPVYPGDEAVLLKQRRAYERDGYTEFILQSGLHIGTHIDAPIHLTADPARICDLPLSRFCGAGRLIDARGFDVIGPEAAETAQAGEIVLFHTGFDAYYGSERYYKSHPVLSEELARLLVEKGVSMVGTDAPSPDRLPFPIHKLLLGHGIPILENLTNLSALLDTPHFEVFALPLNIDAEGSPVRAVARV